MDQWAVIIVTFLLLLLLFYFTYKEYKNLARVHSSFAEVEQEMVSFPQI